jgi:hypothetical protein
VEAGRICYTGSLVLRLRNLGSVAVKFTWFGHSQSSDDDVSHARQWTERGRELIHRGEGTFHDMRNIN